MSKLGAKIEDLPDGISIEGPKNLHGAECSSHYDHRLAMAIGIAGLVAKGKTVIQDAEAVEISYPGFWDDFDRLVNREQS